MAQSRLRRHSGSRNQTDQVWRFVSERGIPFRLRLRRGLIIWRGRAAMGRSTSGWTRFSA